MIQYKSDTEALNDFLVKYNALRSEIGKVIVGQDEVVKNLLIAIFSRGHALLVGVPGLAKTLMVNTLSQVLGLTYSRIQFTPDLMPSDIIGTSIYNLKTTEFEFKQGPLFSNIVLIDEINRAPAKTQSALFEAMEERQITVDGKTYPLEAPFIVLATQNPIEQEGTYRLPEAQLDRFIFKIEVHYPSLEDETKIIAAYHARKNTVDINCIDSVMNAEQIKLYRGKVSELHIDENLISYIAQIVNQTRNNSSLYLGASPRASLAILTSAKAIAAMRGRDFVTPDDIKFVAIPVLKHRVILTPEKEMEGLTADAIIKQIIEKVEVPR